MFVPLLNNQINTSLSLTKTPTIQVSLWTWSLSAVKWTGQIILRNFFLGFSVKEWGKWFYFIEKCILIRRVAKQKNCKWFGLGFFTVNGKKRNWNISCNIITLDIKRRQKWRLIESNHEILRIQWANVNYRLSWFD